jgi:hypothetical protein
MTNVPVPGCAACGATPHDLFPDWDEKVAKAEAAGTYRCDNCAFVFYKTTAHCPSCGTFYPEIRAEQKAASRERDRKALESGETTLEELKEANGLLSKLKVHVDFASWLHNNNDDD